MPLSTIASSLTSAWRSKSGWRKTRRLPIARRCGERKTAPFDRPSPERVREPSRSASFVITTKFRARAGGRRPLAQDPVASSRRGCLRLASMMPRELLRRSGRRATFDLCHYGGLSLRRPSFAWDAFGRRRRLLFRQTDSERRPSRLFAHLSGRASPRSSLRPAIVAELQEWLNARLFRPVYLPAAPSAISLLGARIAPFPGAPAAFLVYASQDRRIGLLVRPFDAPMTRAPELLAADGGNAAIWTWRGQGFALVGDLEAPSLLKIAQDLFYSPAEAVQTMPERGSYGF